MGLRKDRGWYKYNEHCLKTADGSASITKSSVKGQTVYILHLPANGPSGERLCTGPFSSAADAGTAYEDWRQTGVVPSVRPAVTQQEPEPEKARERSFTVSQLKAMSLADLVQILHEGAESRETSAPAGASALPERLASDT